ncbi:protein LNK2-like isoform X2 [Primulina huaijiensis]|uniref:protein LNK2-like isoform X2 n=1 Tax=Primulina huaijiensis TaxID=1492673 RepID=UPI003CC75DF0
MAMFDWNDVELTNITWGETGESDDHIVPYPNRNEENRVVLFGDLANKETNIETSDVSHIKQKKPPTNTDCQVELANISKYNIRDHSPEFGLDLWPDVSDTSVVDVVKNNLDIMGTNGSKSITNSLEDGFSTDEIPQFDKASENLQNPSEDTEKSDHVHYDWANIESFDDLDRIFNHDNPIFGDINVGYADESWSSCKDGNSCPSKITRKSSDSSNWPLVELRPVSDDKAQHTLDLEESFISVSEKLLGNKSQSQDVQARKATIEHFVGNNKLFMNEETPGIDENSQVLPEQLDDYSAATVNAFPLKGNEQKRFTKDQKLKETNKKQMYDLCAMRSTTQSMFEQVNDQYAVSMFKACPPLVVRKQKQVQRSEPFQRKNFSGPLLAPPLYGNMVYHYPRTSHLSSKFQPVGGNRKLACATPVKKSVDAATNPPAMTPEEKIEKLRRRQQLRVIIAIQKQQQQIGNPVSLENSTIKGGNVEVDEYISGFPSLDQNSAIGHDDNNAVTMPLSICPMEESVLQRLQDTISRLDMRTRLCIRDSLFRLAKSAIQRHCSGDTSSANTRTRDEINKAIDNHEGFTGIPDVETNTNPIDRIVAHLLFHTPMESSGELLETPDTPVSATPFYEKKTYSSKSLANGYVPERFESPQVMFPHASKIPSTNVGKVQSKNVPCLDSVENASRDGATVAGGHVNAEAPKSR